MLVPGLLLSILLPLLAGVPWLLIAQRERGPGVWPLALAYGYVFGLLIAVAGLRLLDLVHVPANFATALLLPAVAAIAGWRTIRQGMQFARNDTRAAVRTWRALSRATRVVCLAAVALIALRLLTLGAEILLRPIFPWEAVSAVAAKARVWYELGSIAPFVPPASFIEGLGNFTDTEPGAFALPSLLLAWTAHMVGQWHEGAVGFPWWVMGLVVVLALYGHLRRAGAGLAFSLAVAYLFVSLPLVDLHIGLAGAPQWIAATGVGLAGCALLRWLEAPSRELLYFAAIGAALALLSLLTTWPWFVVFALSALIARSPKSARKLAIGIPLFLLLGLLAWHQIPLKWGAASFPLQIVPAWGETIESLFLLDNWHLLYGAAILVAIVGWRFIVTPAWLARTWAIGMGLAVLFIWGALTVPGLWFGGLRDFSYAALQFAPMLVLWTALVARSLAVPRVDAQAATEPVASSEITTADPTV